MSELVFFLEEPSVQAMLEGLLPQLLQGEVLVRYISNADNVLKSCLVVELQRKCSLMHQLTQLICAL